MRKVYTIIFALTLLFSTTVSVNALEYKSISRQEGISAYASWFETAGNIETYTDLSVTETDGGTDIFLTIWTYDSSTDSASCKWGYMFTQDDVFSVSKKLDSASLSPVEIDVYDEETFEMETLNVRVDWTGTGDLTRGSYTYISKSGDYVAKSSENSISMDATAQGYLDGSDLGTSSFASLVKSKSVYMDMMK